jgi:hypothetical protein
MCVPEDGDDVGGGRMIEGGGRVPVQDPSFVTDTLPTAATREKKTENATRTGVGSRVAELFGQRWGQRNRGSAMCRNEPHLKNRI